MLEIRLKSTTVGFKDIDLKQGIVCGYFSSFGNKDSDGDIIEKGAYANTIATRGPKGKDLIAHLLDHDKTKAIGRVLELKEDDFGLYYESKASRSTLGRDFLLMVEDGIIKNHSVGFYPIKEHFKDGSNHITEIELLEGSSLQFLGASEFTPITGVKSLNDTLGLLSEVERKIKNAKYSDEAIIAIEKQLVSLRNELGERMKQIQHEEKSNTSVYDIFI